MIALSILLAWLALTVGGAMALSALGRAAARSDAKADLASAEGMTMAFADSRFTRPDVRLVRSGAAMSGGSWSLLRPRRPGHPERSLDGLRAGDLR
jgi:hypothetical protein